LRKKKKKSKGKKGDVATRGSRGRGVLQLCTKKKHKVAQEPNNLKRAIKRSEVTPPNLQEGGICLKPSSGCRADSTSKKRKKGEWGKGTSKYSVGVWKKKVEAKKKEGGR